MGFWAFAVVVEFCRKGSQLWKLALLQAFAFSVTAVLSAFVVDWKQGLATLALVSCHRSTYSRESVRPQELVRVFFLLAAAAIAVIVLLATNRTEGMVLSRPPIEFCTKANCTNFTFPFDGLEGNSLGFCGMSWPMGEHDSVSDRCEDTSLGIVDFGQLAMIASYTPNKAQLDEVLATYLPGWRRAPKGTHVYDIEKGRRNTFVHLVRGNTSVIAVRGTSSVAEMMQDLTFWLPVGFMQVFHKLGPTLYSMRSILLESAEASTSHRERIIADIIKYVHEAKEGAYKDHTMYLTGHSLGGGLAAIVGSIMKIKAITFSAPGLQRRRS